MPRFLLTLVCIAMTGCVATGMTNSLAPVAPLVTRGESDGLEDLQDAVHEGSQFDTPERERPNRRRQIPFDGSCKDNSTGTDWTLSPVAAGVFFAPFVLPTVFCDDDYDHVAEFPNYPYAEGAKGSLFLNDSTDAKKQAWTGTLQAVAIPQERDVNRFGARLLLDTDIRFGIDTETNYWTQGPINSPTNQLWTGDANLVYRFAESERMQWRAGIGVNWLTDDVRTEAGFNLTYGFDWFPVKPWTVSSVIDIGSLGHGGLFHTRTTVGAMIGPVEIFAGYDYYKVDSARFQGPVAGIGWRF